MLTEIQCCQGHVFSVTMGLFYTFTMGCFFFSIGQGNAISPLTILMEGDPHRKKKSELSSCEQQLCCICFANLATCQCVYPVLFQKLQIYKDSAFLLLMNGRKCNMQYGVKVLTSQYKSQTPIGKVTLHCSCLQKLWLLQKESAF